MKYQIDRSSGESAYLQLYRQLKEDIVGGLLPIYDLRGYKYAPYAFKDIE